jgi:hypothetical protein
MLLGAAAALFVFGQTAAAHNNPQMQETLIQTVSFETPKTAEPVTSELFQLTLPPRTIELVWKVTGDKVESVRFTVVADGKTVANDVHHGQVTPLIKAGQFRLVDIRGASSPFKIEVFANVMAKR